MEMWRVWTLVITSFVMVLFGILSIGTLILNTGDGKRNENKDAVACVHMMISLFALCLIFVLNN